MSIDAAFTELEQSRTSWRALHDLLVNSGYDVVGARPSIGGQSVKSFAKRVDLVFEGLFALRPSENEAIARAEIWIRGPPRFQLAEATG